MKETNSSLYARVDGRVGLLRERSTKTGKDMVVLRVATASSVWVEVLVVGNLVEVAQTASIGERILVSGTPFADAYISRKTNEPVAQLKLWANNIIYPEREE